MTAVHRWLAEPLPTGVAQALERLAAARGVVHVAVMPDVHLAADVCIGTVLGTDEWLYPQAVGGDIGCGMAAVRLRGVARPLADAAAAEQLFAVLRQQVPAIRQRRPRPTPLGPLSDPALQRAAERGARVEFGTLGRGNHFLEVQTDEGGDLWLLVHCGSRAVGRAIHEHHLARGERVGKGLFALAAAGAGQAYLHDHQRAVEWAQENRRTIAAAAAPALQDAFGVDVDWATWFDMTHNFVRREEHDGRHLWVHRKGANPAAAGERGIVPGSMGTRTFHVRGCGQAAALCSSSHGAGRRLARGEAARTIRVRDLERELRAVFYDRTLAGRLCDQAPSAYKDIGAVMRAQHDLVRIERTLRPLLVFKGG